MKNDIDNLDFQCNDTGGCLCYFQRLNENVCEMTGMDVLREYGYEDVNVGLWIGILARTKN